MVNLKMVYAGCLFLFMGCGAAPQSGSKDTQTSTTITTAAVAAFVDTPYAFSGNSSCWTDKIKTNGPSYGVGTGNSGYFCHVIGSGSSLDSDYFWVGFYRNGTVSYTRRGSIDVVYTAFANPANCDLGFDNANHSLRYVNFEGGILDASSHLINITNQQYYAAPPALTDQYALSCVFKTIYGTQ